MENTNESNTATKQIALNTTNARTARQNFLDKLKKAEESKPAPKVSISNIGTSVVEMYANFAVLSENGEGESEIPLFQEDLPVEVYDAEKQELSVVYPDRIAVYLQQKSETDPQLIKQGILSQQKVIASAYKGDLLLVAASLGVIPGQNAKGNDRMVVDVQGLAGPGVVTVGMLHSASLDKKHPLHDAGRAFVAASKELATDNSMIRFHANNRTSVPRFNQNKPVNLGWTTASQIGELIREIPAAFTKAATLWDIRQASLGGGTTIGVVPDQITADAKAKLAAAAAGTSELPETVGQLD